MLMSLSFALKPHVRIEVNYQTSAFCKTEEILIQLTLRTWCYPKLREFDHKKFLTVTPSVHRLLRSSHLERVYCDPSVFPMILRIPGSPQVCVDNLLQSYMDLLSRVQTTPFQP